MANTKLILLSIFLIFAIMTNSIATEEAAAATENKAEAQSEAHEGEEEHEHEGAMEGEGEGEGEGEMNPEDAQGNILDEAGKEDLKELGFDVKESLTTDEMKTLYQKVLLKAEISDPQEREFYEKLIENVMKEVPAEVKQADIRNFFDIPFLMKFVDQSGMQGGPEGAEGEDMPQEGEATPEGAKTDM